MVQWDILYIGDQMVAHLIDEATRWTVLHILDRRLAIVIITGITNGWIRPHGPMKLLIADIEGGLHGEEASQWLDRWGIQMKAKEEGSHAQLVERHHDLARKIIHRVRCQLDEEGIAMPLEIVIAECALIKNLLITVAGYSPYQAVYGRLPPLLAEFEPVSDCQIDDQSAGIPGISRHHHRLRELAMQAMVEMTAKDRLRRALRSKTRTAQESLQLSVGDQVDFHRPPSTKEESGWRGPATLLQVGPPALVRWQGRVLQVRTQDLRRSLVYVVMFTNNIFFEAGSTDPVATIMSYADQLDNKVVRVGWIFDAEWRRTADSRKLSELVLAVLHVAACGFYLVGCIGARVGNGVSVLEGMVGCDNSFLWWWRRGRPELSWYHEASGSARLRLVQIFGKDDWRDTSFVQFVMTDGDSVQELRRREPDIPHLGGPWFGNLPHARRYEQPERAEPGPFQEPPELQEEDFDMPSASRQTSGTMRSSSADSSMRTSRRSASTSAATASRRSRSERGRPRPRAPDSNPTAARDDPPSVKPGGEVRERSRSRDDPDRDSGARGSGDGPPVKPDTGPRERSRSRDAPDRGRGSRDSRASSAAAGADAPLHEPVLPIKEDDAGEDESDTDSDATQEYVTTSWRYMKDQASLPAVDVECAQHDFFFAAPDADHVTEVAEERFADSRPDCVEIGIGAPLMYWVYPEVGHVRRPGPGEIYILRVFNTGKREIVVEREMNVLTLEEARAHEVEVRQAMKDELQRWAGLKAFQRFPKDQADNIIDSRWVLKWKEIDGQKQVRARLTVRGFKDLQSPELATFAGTTTRWGQRLVNQVTAQRKWRLFSADISQAFLRGLTFEQVAAMDGEVKRKVQFTMPPGSIPVLRQLEGYEDFNPVTEVLLLLRCGFGLKDAPRLWQVMLKQVMEKTGGKPLISDPQIYVYHDAKGELQMIMSSHVDDLKGGGEDQLREKVLDMIESEFGKLKRQYDRFECIGIMHEQDVATKAIWTHQQHYVLQLRPLQVDQYAMENEDSQVSLESHAAYMSLLGGIAWMTQTMAPIAVYVSYLQRQAKKPVVGDVRKINRLLKWILTNVKQLGVRFIALDMPRVRLAVVSDSAFHAMEFEGLAIRGCVIMLLETGDEVLRTGSTYRVVMLDWYSRKQNTVVRSTYAAELMALLDALGTGTLMNVALTEIVEGVSTASEMMKRQESGNLVLQMIAAIDAKAVFDAISADTIKVTTDKRMYVPTLAAREQLDRMQLRQLSWIDTMDMVADALTKGEIDRGPLLLLGVSNTWRLSGLAPVAFSARSVS